jgi:hypothetical protein
MNTQVLTIVGGVLTALLGGGFVKGFLDYRADRRRTDNEFSVSTFATLKEMNDLLRARVAELEKLLDDEQSRRRSLEDRVAALEREVRP